MENNQPQSEEEQLDELPIKELTATFSDKDEVYMVLSEMMGCYLPPEE